MPAESPRRTVSSPGAVLSTATATGIILVCGVVTGLIAARSLGPTGRGQLAMITVWSSTLLYAGTFGLPEAVAYLAAANPALRDRIWATAQIAAMGLGVVISALGWWLMPLIFSGPDHADTVRWIQWYLLLFAVPCLSSLCACSWLQGVGRLTAFNVSRTTVHLVNAIGFAILLLSNDTTVWHFASVLLIGNAATWLLACACKPRPFAAGAAPSASLATKMFHYGIRVQVGNWSSAANVRLDQLLLSLFAAPASLGIYVVAVTYTNVVLALPGSGSLVMLPELVDEHRRGAARQCLQRWYRRLMWTTAGGAAAIGLSGAYLLPLLFGDAFSAAIPLLTLLVPASVLLGMNQILLTAFRGIDRPEIGSAAEMLGLAVTAAALVLLLPPLGVLGAASASLLAYGATHVYLVRRAMAIFDIGFAAMCMPTMADVHAALRMGHATRGFFRRAAPASAGTQALP